MGMGTRVSPLIYSSAIAALANHKLGRKRGEAPDWGRGMDARQKRAKISYIMTDKTHCVSSLPVLCHMDIWF